MKSVLRWLVIVVLASFHHVPAANPGEYAWWQEMRKIDLETYLCQRSEEALDIDGKMDEKSWKQASWTGYFGNLGSRSLDEFKSPEPVPYFKTRVKMLWDDYYFYIAAEMEEPHVWSTFLWHDQILCLENNFEIFIDPNGDNHNYFEIEINPLNTVWDLIIDKPYRDGAKPDQDWDILGLKRAVHVDGTLNDPRDIDEGWTLEMAIPWNALAEFADCNTPPGEGDQWRVNFARTEFEHEIIQSEHTTKDVTGNAYRLKEGARPDIWSWSSHGTFNLHTPEMFGIVQFTGNDSGGTQAVLDPFKDEKKRLLDIYFAQRDYFKQHDTYTDDITDLDLKPAQPVSPDLHPEIALTPDGYTASIDVKTLSGLSVIRIRQDSKILQQHR